MCALYDFQETLVHFTELLQNKILAHTLGCRIRPIHENRLTYLFVGVASESGF